MSNGIFSVPVPINEPIYDYAPGSKERELLEAELKRQSDIQVEVPVIIGGKEIKTGKTAKMVSPHDHKHVLGTYHQAGEKEVELAIETALKAKEKWENMEWQDRAAIFLRAAELISTKYRYILNAATMLNQSKSAYQAEIDSTCEFADFLRFNVHFMQQIYSEQPVNSKGMWNRLQYRALEGFVFAVTPFNFTAIAGNLPCSPAMMGNVVLWKPASTSILSNYYLMKLFKEAGLPDGVINFLPGRGGQVGDPVIASKHFSGLHFTGSTGTFKRLWKGIADNIDNYLTYPKIVGETGGKDFIVVHKSADPKQVAVAAVRGSFEYQGQKCSASSRMYVPSNLWSEISKEMKSMLKEIKVGDVKNFRNFMNAVIDENSFDNIMSYIEKVKASDNAEIIFGGEGDKTDGYYVDPTIIVTKDPKSITMEEEIFGPVLTVYVYDGETFDEVLELCDKTSPYALTGAIFARDREVIVEAEKKLKDAAGNFYINDKPTGAVVGQQPFGGARGSGTNDKAGAVFNMLRWTSPRTIKETFCPASDYKYPFMS